MCSFVNTFVVKKLKLKGWLNLQYHERIQFIRESKNITQKEIAAHLNIKQQQYARYEKGVNVMPVTYLKEICLFLNVSADYIVGLPNDMEYPTK